MTVRLIAEYLSGHPFFAVLDAATVEELAGCARNEHIRAGQYLFREGGTADHFYVIMHGRIALELHSPGTGPLVVETVSNGEVLDWPWLIPPHRWSFDARATEPTSVISLDSGCLRAKCDADPRLGYELLQRVAHVMSARLQATRLRLLDLYGDHPGAPGEHTHGRATETASTHDARS
jgi:CRP/FNR family transcriptional regulator, cyclic AMP receptor protein